MDLKDILKNISCFLNNESENKQPTTPQMLQRPEIKEPWLNYRVNLFVDNSNLTGSPVIMDSNYQYHNLFGKLEYENQYGMLKTDFTMIKPGLLHTANGGYLILQVKDILTNPMSWEALKRALRTEEIQIENMKDQMNVISVSGLKPEPIPLNLKVILIGDASIYHTLLSMDEDFRKLFKIKVDLLDEFGPDLELDIPNGKIINKNYVGKNIKNYDSMLILSHFKGHQLGGFGGALKNLSIGVASAAGKAWIHSAGKVNDVEKTYKMNIETTLVQSVVEAIKSLYGTGDCLVSTYKYSF